jgi:NAD-dependent deacetylase
MLIIGTSGMVRPAANLPYIVGKLGTMVVQINPVKTELDEVAQFNLQGKAGDVLPQLLAATFVIK